MAWNRSSGQPNPVNTSGNKRGIAAGVVAVLGVALALIYFCVRDQVLPSSEEESKSSGKIAVAKHHVVSNAVPSAEQSSSSAAKTNGIKKLTAKEERDIRNGRRKFYPPANTSVAFRVSHEMSLFSNQAEREIACLLIAEPGRVMLGSPNVRFGKKFRESLQNALVSKIEISDADSEYDRQLKQQVIDAKQELVDRIKNGEDGVQILKDTYMELQQLGLYKQELEAQIVKAYKNGEVADEDLELTVEAANKMLAERGCSKMKMPGMFKGRVKLLQMKREGIDKNKKGSDR